MSKKAILVVVGLLAVGLCALLSPDQSSSEVTSRLPEPEEDSGTGLASAVLGQLCPAEEAIDRFNCLIKNHPDSEIREDLFDLIYTKQVGLVFLDRPANFGDDPSHRGELVVGASVFFVDVKSDGGLRKQLVLQINPKFLRHKMPLLMVQANLVHEYQHIKDARAGRFPAATFSLISEDPKDVEEDGLLVMQVEMPAYVAQCKFAQKMNFVPGLNTVCHHYVAEGERGIARFIVQTQLSSSYYDQHRANLLRQAERWK